MSTSEHASEEELVAFHMQEHATPEGVRQHLEQCATCAAHSSSIAQAMRVFSGDAVPEPDLSQNWERLRGRLTVLDPSPQRSFRSFVWPAAAGLAAALALVIFVTAKFQPVSHVADERSAAHRPGPLTTAPTNPEVARQLDSAERLLTEVNHASGPLDATTRLQAHDLLLKNAVVLRSARQNGDLVTATILEDLDRVLTNIDHQPETAPGGVHLRLELNTNGVLLDIRILRQNDSSL
jgi:hypothetical protein